MPSLPSQLARLFRIFPVLSLFAASFASAQTVAVDGGEVAGAVHDNIVSYLGIPFAAPPVGDLRWRAPQPVLPWQGILPATEPRSACIQSGVSIPGEQLGATSEDCLYLNVWAPAQHDGSLPVIVWIYGGGWTNGSATMPLYAGDRLARRGVVVVTVAYRIGPLGFLAHPELTAESADHSSGNYGIADQVAALNWVQRNISAFGGDPARVTIAGQSAGSMSVSILMASPAARGLFAGAIGQSGGFFEPPAIAPQYLLANAEAGGTAYAEARGAFSLAQLRALPAEELLGDGAVQISHPIIEPVYLPRPPYDVFAAGEQAQVPVLVGYNRDEPRSLSDIEAVTADNFDDLLTRQWGQLPPPIVEAYPYATDAEARAARTGLERDLRFGWNAWTWARLQAGHGGAAAYAYLFTRTPPFPPGTPYAGWGAAHFAELWYTFDHLDQLDADWTVEDRDLAELVASYWANFARSGNPNAAGLPNWSPFLEGSQQAMHLGGSVGMGDLPDAAGRTAFDLVYSSLRDR